MPDRVAKALLGVIAVCLLGLLVKPSVLPAVAQSPARQGGAGITTDANGFHVYVVHDCKIFIFARDTNKKSGLQLEGIQLLPPQS